MGLDGSIQEDYVDSYNPCGRGNFPCNDEVWPWTHNVDGFISPTSNWSGISQPGGLTMCGNYGTGADLVRMLNEANIEHAGMMECFYRQLHMGVVGSFLITELEDAIYSLDMDCNCDPCFCCVDSEIIRLNEDPDSIKRSLAFIQEQERSRQLEEAKAMYQDYKEGQALRKEKDV